MEFLLFQLQAPLASWGAAAVGEYRGSDGWPSQSALLGLLAAALGLTREQESQLMALQRGYRFAIGVQSTGHLLRDYHTAQVPPKAAMKGRPHATRRDELALPAAKLSTILSTRDYRQDAACIVVVQALADAPHSLTELAVALREPRFVLYLGRKSCPPAAPLFPQLLEAEEACAALGAYQRILQERLTLNAKPSRQAPDGAQAPIIQLVWCDQMPVACEAHLSTTRKDRVLNRQGWQFGDRTEHSRLFNNGDEPCTSA